MGDVAGLKIVVGADVSGAIANVGKLDQTLDELQKELNAIGRAIDQAIAKGQDISKLEDAFDKVNNKVKAMKAEIAKAAPTSSLTEVKTKVLEVGTAADTAGKGIVGAANNAFGAIRKIAYVLPGVGIAGIFALIGSGIVAAGESLGLFNGTLFKTSDAAKHAEEDAKKLKDTLFNIKSAGDVTQSATGSEAGNIARVQALSAAIQDTNRSYKERKNALDELRETNKAYFGDLTLEAASLKTLSGRVNEYSQALIQEAIVKGQVEEISKMTTELLKQVQAENKLKDARDRAQAALDAAPASGGGLSVGGGQSSVSQQDFLAVKVTAATKAYEAQKDAVLQIRSAIASYNGELNNAITLQLKQKPLQTAPGYKDELKAVIPILEQIKKIYEEIQKPNKENLHTQFAQAAEALNTDSTVYKLFQARIAEAYRNAIKDPANASAYRDLATAFQAQLAHIQSPNLSSHIQGIVDVKASDLDKVESQIEKTLGGSKGLQIKVPATLKLSLDEQGYSKEEQQILLKKAEEDALKGLKPIPWNPKIQAIINQKDIVEGVLLQLNETTTKIVQGIAAAGLSQIGIAIGAAISGGGSGLQKALQGFGSILGDGLIAIGKELITASTIIKGIKTALNELFANPVVGIVVGVAAVAAGEILKSEVNKTGARAFATGGIVTGPTNALIGEAGPEVVFPLQELNRFVKNTQGNGQQTVRIVGKLSGRDINIAAARDNKMQNLV